MFALSASAVGPTHRARVSDPDLLLQLFARGSHNASTTGGATVAFLLGASESGREGVVKEASWNSYPKPLIRGHAQKAGGKKKCLAVFTATKRA